MEPFHHPDECACRTCKALRVLAAGPVLKMTLGMLAGKMNTGGLVTDCIDFGLEHCARVLAEEYGEWLAKQGTDIKSQVYITGDDLKRALDQVMAEVNRRKAEKREGMRKN